MTKVKVTQKEGEEEIPTEIIASAIVEISDGMKKIKAGRLNDKAIIYLIHKSSGIKQDDVARVLTAMERLKKDYLK